MLFFLKIVIKIIKEKGYSQIVNEVLFWVQLLSTSIQYKTPEELEESK